MEFKEIGIIRSVFKSREQAPHQGIFSTEISTVEVFPEYIEGLKELEHLSHIIILYWANKSDRNRLGATPPWATGSYGVFSTRSPNRPNPISFAVCKIISVENNLIKVTGLDALDGSPLLDIKAYSAKLDSYPEAKSHPESESHSGEKK